MFYLRDIRKRAGITMKELGQRVGVTESAIGLYETEKRKPNYEMLVKLSKALDCSVLDLLGEDAYFIDETETFDEFGNSAGPQTTITINNDPALLALLEDYAHRPGMRMLFKLAHDATEEDVQTAARIIEALRKSDT